MFRAEKPILDQNQTYDHYPVDIQTFVESPEYMGGEAEVWPEVKKELLALFDTDPFEKRFSSFREIVYDWGIGSGKSFIVSAIFTYPLYRLLCYKNPLKEFGLARGSTIAILNMSKTATQARKVVFHEVKQRIEQSPWFQRYAPPDPKVQSELRFPKNIVLFPGNSKETTPLGYNVIVCAIDEASFFTETAEKDLAQEVYDALDRRVTSRFGEFGLMATVSSPRYIDDFTERKYAESETDGRILGSRKATWESKPDDIKAIAEGDCFTLKHPSTGEEVKIPNKYRKAFERNPQKAWRDFGAVASLVLEPYFGEEEYGRIATIIKGGITATVENVQPRQGFAYATHIDLGLKRDACGVAVGHYEDGGIIIDLIVRIVSAKRAKQLQAKGEPYDMIIGRDEVNFEGVRQQVVYRLQERGFDIAKATFDGFQSVDFRQQLEAHGIATEYLSVDKDTKAYDTFKSLLNTDRFYCPNHPFFGVECKRLEKIKGNKVDHPPSGSKDLADSVAGVCRSIMDEFDEEQVYTEKYVDDDNRVEVTDQI